MCDYPLIIRHHVSVMWEPDSKEPSGHHVGPNRTKPDSKEPSGHHEGPNRTKPSDHSTQEPVLIIGDHRVCEHMCMLVCVCEGGLHSEYGSWNPEDIYREKKQKWHTLLNFNEEAMLFDRLMTAYLKEASIPVTTKSLSPLLVKPIREWTTSPATNSAEKRKKKEFTV